MFEQRKEEAEKKLILKELILRKYGTLNKFAEEKRIFYNDISRFLHYLGNRETAKAREIAVLISDSVGFNINEISITELRSKIKGN